MNGTILVHKFPYIFFFSVPRVPITDNLQATAPNRRQPEIDSSMHESDFGSGMGKTHFKATLLDGQNVQTEYTNQ
jgi:hypothetical protein